MITFPEAELGRREQRLSSPFLISCSVLFSFNKLSNTSRTSWHTVHGKSSMTEVNRETDRDECIHIRPKLIEKNMVWIKSFKEKESVKMQF